MGSEWVRWVAGAGFGAAISLGGWAYSSTNARIADHDLALAAARERAAIIETKMTATENTLKRLEDKLDWLIRTENEQHRLTR